ncbi:MAG: integrin alpha, partial [Phycisphaerae bacterium]
MSKPFSLSQSASHSTKGAKMKLANLILVCGALLIAVPLASAQPGWVLFTQKLSSTEGGFSCPLRTNDYWATSIAGIGDLDRDGIEDIAVGAYGDDDGNPG